MGLVRSGNFAHGTPITLPHQFGTPVELPEPFGNVIPQSNPTLNSNPVTWSTSPAHFGNMVAFSLQAVAPIVITSENSTATTNIVVTDIGSFTGAVTLTYSGAPSGVSVSFSPNPTTSTSVATITVGSSVPDGKYTITITGTSGSATKETKIHLVVTGTAAATYSISGTISGAGGAGAQIALTGTSSASTTADGSGNYSFSGLSNGSYTITPYNTGYTFTPTNQSESVSGSNVTGVNFTSSANTPSPIASGLMAVSPVGTGNVTLDTTGANFLVAVVGWYTAAGASAVPQDNLGNSWVGLTPQNGVSPPDSCQIYYVEAATVGSSQEFSLNVTGNSYSWAAVYAFSNMATSGVFNVQNGTTNQSSPVQPGSITPSAGDVVICGFSTDRANATATINDSFATPIVQPNASIECGAASYLIGAAASPLNPSWTVGSADNNVVIASFKAA